MGRYKKLKPVDRLLKCYLKKLKEIGFKDAVLLEMFIDDIPEPMERYRARLRVEKLLKELEKVKQDSRYEGISPYNLMN